MRFECICFQIAPKFHLLIMTLFNGSIKMIHVKPIHKRHVINYGQSTSLIIIDLCLNYIICSPTFLIIRYDKTQAISIYNQILSQWNIYKNYLIQITKFTRGRYGAHHGPQGG